jgi:hypothetical protein
MASKRTKKGLSAMQGSHKMHSHSSSQDLLACAAGALLFAGLSLGAALFPLIVA